MEMLKEVGGFEGEVVDGEDQFSQWNECVGGRVMVVSAGEKETGGLEAFAMADEHVQGLGVHGEDEALGAGETKVMEDMGGVGGVLNVWEVIENLNIFIQEFNWEATIFESEEPT
ncbi:hypothetical protein chiPu_0013312 [Chiloscyllium punctatum]|uniref:Uncharacterized protein n=1 Tax=Chiloscyllium punctatum TaxID=137246 RepID=A0A401SWS0_CHIPU|nr:hypothetical protein [Chiloscyllium punctatum]